MSDQIDSKSLQDFMEWREKNPDQPLFLPPGSVRSIIVLLLLVFSGIMLIRGIAIPEWFQSITVMAVAFYYGTRSKN